ncbi:MAG: DUF1569 domain-containing protein [Acidobacteria bacterium]|nr:DUF1569 domain-containing protein [Acidobacteriota bacterium]
MKSIWDESAREELLARFGKLRVEQRPRWGKLDVAHMLAHVCDPMRAAMGEMVVTDKDTFLKNPLMRWLIIYVVPWPKGAPTAPEFTVRTEADLSSGIAAVQATMTRFAVCVTPKPHPAFGDLSRKDWGCLTWRHIDHHLRQFGV